MRRWLIDAPESADNRRLWGVPYEYQRPGTALASTNDCFADGLTVAVVATPGQLWRRG